MPPGTNPGDNGNPPTPPAAPAAPPAEPQAPPTPPAPTPPGNEPDNNPGGQPGAMVPSDRLREETEKRRQAEEESARLQAELDSRPAVTPTVNEDDDLDPEVEDLIRKGAKKLGLVSQTELDAIQTNAQVRQDVTALEATPPVPGIPYDHKAVMAYAEANNLPITSKAALQAAYKEMNWDKIVEAERNRAIDGYKAGNGGGAEKPGSGGATPPSEPDVTGRNPKERIKSRIGLARQKLNT